MVAKCILRIHFVHTVDGMGSLPFLKHLRGLQSYGCDIHVLIENDNTEQLMYLLASDLLVVLPNMRRSTMN